MKSEQILKHFDYLGLPVQDRVTKFKGVVTNLSFDLYGCIQCIVTSQVNETVASDSYWFDICRLEVLDDTPVMEACYDNTYVTEGTKGCAMKSIIK